MYKVSICVPVYGVEKFIERCAVSLFEQTYENIEYVFVNDCTKDNSMAVLSTVMNRYPSRYSNVKIINHPINKGLAATRNTAVDNASGKFLLHIDSDDFLDTDTIEKLVKAQLTNDSDIVLFDTIKIFPNRTQTIHKKQYRGINEYLIEALQKKVGVGVCGNMIRTSLYHDNSIRAVDGLNMAEDYQVTPRLIFYAKSITTANNTYYHYDLTNQSSYVHNITFEACEQLKESMKVIQEFFRDKDIVYRRAINEGVAKAASIEIIASARQTDGKRIYEYARKWLEENKPYSGVSLKTYERIALRIRPYLFLKVYVQLFGKVKRLLKI